MQISAALFIKVSFRLAKYSFLPKYVIYVNMKCLLLSLKELLCQHFKKFLSYNF